jgi:glucokinase
MGERYGALIGKPNVTARDLIEAASSDACANKLLENSLLSIASYLGQLINILDPSVMVIGGGIGGNPAINARLGELTRPFIFADLARDLPIMPAMLGDNASVIGVAALAHRAATSQTE